MYNLGPPTSVDEILINEYRIATDTRTGFEVAIKTVSKINLRTSMLLGNETRQVPPNHLGGSGHQEALKSR
jgi:hypothetical protein